MADRKNSFSVAAWLYRLGSLIQFSPTSPFSTSSSEVPKGEGRLSARFLPYKKKVKSALAKNAEQSAFLILLHRLIQGFFTLRIRSFGVFFFSCGFFQILTYFAASVIPGYEPSEVNLLFGVAQIFLTLLCSFARGDVADVVKRSFLFRGILRPFLGVREWQIPGGKSHDHLGEMLFFGLFVGAVSLLVSPVELTKLFLMVALVLLVFYRPEAGVVVCGVGTLFFSAEMLLLIIFLTLIAYLFKCAVGKRSLVFSPMDPVMLLFFLPYLSGDIRNQVPGFFTLFFLSFLTSGLVRTLSGLKSLLSSVTVASFVLSVFLVMRQGVELLFPTAFLQVEELEQFFFVQPTAETGILVAMAIPLVLGQLRSAEKSSVLMYFASFVIHCAALFFVENSQIWLAAILGIAVWFLFSYKASLLLLCIAGLSVTAVLRILPRKASLWFLSLFGLESESIWSSASAGQSLWQAFVEKGGILWLLFFFLLLGVFIYEVVGFCVKTTRAEIHTRILGVLCSVVVFFAVSAQQLALDYRSFALFVLLLSLPRAAHQAARQEEVRLPY